MNPFLGKHPTRRPRDVQKQRLYDFEKNVIRPGCDMSAVSKSHVRDLIEHVMTEFGMEHVPWIVSWFEVPNAQCIMSSRGTIHFNIPREHRRSPWVLHEIAHSISGTCDHGPRFIAAYFVLLDTYLGMDFNALKESAEAKGLKVGLKRYAPKRVKRSTRVLSVAA